LFCLALLENITLGKKAQYKHLPWLKITDMVKDALQGQALKFVLPKNIRLG
jgi:hypothetical protein